MWISQKKFKSLEREIESLRLKVDQLRIEVAEAKAYSEPLHVYSGSHPFRREEEVSLGSVVQLLLDHLGLCLYPVPARGPSMELRANKITGSPVRD